MKNKILKEQTSYKKSKNFKIFSTNFELYSDSRPKFQERNHSLKVIFLVIRWINLGISPMRTFKLLSRVVTTFIAILFQTQFKTYHLKNTWPNQFDQMTKFCLCLLKTFGIQFMLKHLHITIHYFLKKFLFIIFSFEGILYKNL